MVSKHIFSRNHRNAKKPMKAYKQARKLPQFLSILGTVEAIFNANQIMIKNRKKICSHLKIVFRGLQKTVTTIYVLK